MNYKRITLCLTILLLIIFSSCKKAEVKQAIIPEVTVVNVGQQNVSSFSEFVGETYGQSDVDIKPRVEGWIKSINFKEGSTVKKGQLLYSIQDDELRERETSSSAQLAQANIMLAKAKADLDRVRPLVEMNALSKRDLDAAQATYDAQKQAVIAAQAGLNNSQTQLSYTQIKSPIDGVIGISTVQVGDYVSKTSLQSTINTISSIGALRIRFSITENDYLRFKKKSSAEELKSLDVQFILSDGTIFPETGKLDFADRTIDPSTGSMIVQAVVENKSRLLRPGQYVKVRLKSNETPDAILVPQQAINQMQNIYLAMVVNDSNMVKPTPVKVGDRIGSNWIILGGLKSGQRVALIGNAIIKPGMVVNPIMKNYSYDSTSVVK